MFNALLTIPSSQIVTANSALTILAAYSEASFLNGRSNLFTPSLFWRNGKTYAVIQKNINVTPLGQIGLVVYDENLGLDRTRIVGKPLPTGDTHSQPSMTVTDGDYLYAVQEATHIVPLDIYKADVAGDVESFTELAENIGSGMAYSNIFKLDSNYGILHRYGSSVADADVYFIKSTNGFETWGSGVKITDRSTTPWHYPTVPKNASVGVWKYFVVTQRAETTLHWFNYWVLKTQDFVTFYNYSGSYSKDITGSPLTETELNANFAYYAGSSANQYFVPCTAIDNDGNFYAVNGDGSTGYTFTYNVGAGFVAKAINISNLVDAATLGSTNDQDGAYTDIFAYSRKYVEAIWRVDEGTYTRLQRWKTTDLGDTWELIDSPFDNINADLYLGTYPFNINQIPRNRNFIIYAGKFANSGTVDTYYVECAKGTIQPKSGARYYDTIIELNDIANCAFHYEITAGKITNTGTVVNSLIDQSGNGRTGTPSGSPVWNSVDTLVFDGINDLITIPTTGLTANSEASFIGVFKYGTAAWIMTFGRTTDSAFYWTFFGASDSTKSIAFQGAHGTGTTNGVYGQTTLDDGAFHILSWVVKQNIVYVYIDGVRQEFQLATAGSSNRALIGDYLDNTTGINSLVLGALKRATTTYGNASMKECAYYTRFLTDAQRYGAEVMLAAKYGLNLGTNQYQ